jgi:hypothetical protein
VFLEHAEEFTVPAEQCLWLDKEKRLFPEANHLGEEHEKKSVRLSIPGMFYLSAQDEQLLS